MSRSVAAKVRTRKEAKPHLYCAEPRCLWYIGPGGKPCANHPAPKVEAFDRHGNTLIPCATCGERTALIATGTCDRCWEKANPAQSPGR